MAPHLRRREGFSLLELLAVIAVILIIAALAIPQILGMQAKARNRECDSLFHALDTEISNMLDDLLFTSTEVIGMVLDAHQNEHNPWDTSFKLTGSKEPVFVTESGGIPGHGSVAALHACQVALNVDSGGDPLTVLVEQWRKPEDEGITALKRSFKITTN